MVYFTPAIWKIIFEYDPTFHQIFNNVLLELHSVTYFWKIRTVLKYKTQDNNILSIPSPSSFASSSFIVTSGYCKSYKNTKELSYYWNHQYRLDVVNPDAWIHPEFIKDKYPDYNYLIFNDIKTFRNLHKKMIRDTGNSERYYKSLLKI